MQQMYAELIVYNHASDWQIKELSNEFLALTGFSHEDVKNRFHNSFIAFFSEEKSIEIKFLLSNCKEESCIFSETFDLKNNYKHKLQIALQATRIAEEQVRICIIDITVVNAKTGVLEERISSLEKVVPCGLCQFLLNDELTIIWHNQQYLDILGYTPQQFSKEINQKVVGYVYPDDLNRVRKNLNDLLEHKSNSIILDIRIVKRNKNVRNLIMTFCLTGETYDGYPICYSAGIDITDNKQNRSLQCSTECYRIAMEQSASCIFEYDIQSRTLLNAQSDKKLFGFTDEMSIDKLVADGIVHRDSVESFLYLFELEHLEEKAECIVLIKEIQGEYIW